MTPPSTPPSEEAESTDGLSHAVDPGLVGKALNSAFDPYDRLVSLLQHPSSSHSPYWMFHL